MNSAPAKINLDQWGARYAALRGAGFAEPWYGGPLGRHMRDGDLRLRSLMLDSSPAALRLWNLVLTEEDRLHQARAEGKKIVGAMKDLGTVPVLAYSAAELVCFYPDGAWWTPCLMECSDGLFAVADALGIDDTFCPVRAMLGAFESKLHFPIPDLLTCSVGATCDDFTAIAQQVEHLGYRIVWWETPHRRIAEIGEEAVTVPGEFVVPRCQVDTVRQELECIRQVLGDLAGQILSDDDIHSGICAANDIRRLVEELRQLVYTSTPCPLPALEMLLVEVLPIHFCSDRAETRAVLIDLLVEVRRRRAEGAGVLPDDAIPLYWVNPVADLRVMNLLEDCGGRICGADYMFGHARTLIPENVEPMEALARMVLSDPMVGTARDRAAGICRELPEFGAQAVIISRIPGASHCATEGRVIQREIARQFPSMPVIEIEVPPVADALLPALQTRIEALVETVKGTRAYDLCGH